MIKPQIIGLGLSGLVGSRIVELLRDKYDFVDLSISKGIDITKQETLKALRGYRDARFVLHLAAKADVDGCEKDKIFGKDGDAWRLNVLGAKNVAQICALENKKMIYISTDFVFDGTKPQEQSYSEDDTPNPLGWYAKTKYQGEKEVETSGCEHIIARIGYPYRAKYEIKKDFFRAVLDRLNQGLEVRAITDHIFCPTLIDDIAYALDSLITNDASGIYHIVGSGSVTPYDAALKITEVFNLDLSLVSKTTREEFFKDRAPRPFNLSLKNDKIKQLGVKMRSFEEGLSEIKRQLEIF